MTSTLSRQRRRLRVALVSFDFGEYCVPLANELAREVDVCLVLPHGEAAPVLTDLSPAVRFRPFHKPGLRQPLRQLRTCAGLVSDVIRFRPDVVHLQQGHLWFNLFLPLLGRYPLVLTVHDPRPHLGDRGGRKTPQPVMRIGFRRAERLIVHAERLKPDVGAQGVAEKRTHTIPHVAVGDRTPAPGVEEEDGLILFFGRLWPYKGLDYLIRAEPLVSAEFPNVRIAVAGQGEDFGRYRALMKHPDRFVVHDEFVSNKKRAELFARASVVVLPYVEASQSGVVPVAYSFAKPVVATAVGGLPEVVEDGRTGFVVPPRDEKALAHAILRLLRDPALRRELGAAGRRKLEREWSPAVVARQTLAVYELAAARTPAPLPRGRPRQRMATTPGAPAQVRLERAMPPAARKSS
jgi:glycosyltransferase involved in cell wall biosynthesis